MHDEVNRKRGSAGKRLEALPRAHSDMSAHTDRFRWNVILLALVCIASTVVLAALARPRAMVLKAVASGGRVVYERRVDRGDEFDISYTHSVAKTPVVERFRIMSAGQMLLYETVYQDFGAGLPSEIDKGAQVEVGPDGVRITGMERIMTSIPLRVGSIARHQIACGNDVVDLISLVESGERVDIAVAARALLPYTRR